MSNEPNFGKNYFIAFLLSLLILVLYPYYLKWIAPPPAESPQPAGEIATEISEQAELAQTETRIMPAEGPFIESPAKPASIHFESDDYDITFSTLGGSISRLLYKGEPGKQASTRSLLFDGDAARPGLFGVRLLHEDKDLTQIGFKAVRKGKDSDVFEFEFEQPGEYRLLKRFLFADHAPAIELETELTNLADRAQHFPLEIEYGLFYENASGENARFIEAAASAEKVLTANIGKVAKKGFQVSQKMEWAGLLKKYFAILVRPDAPSVGFLVKESSNEHMWAKQTLEPLTIAPGATERRTFFIYAGPQRYETLKEFDFDALLSRGWFGIFKVWILGALRFFYQYTHNYGWAIIIVTLIIKGLFTPLTHISFENMKKMQAIQPKMKSIQERHKDNPEKMNREMMELYRRNKVNPMMGCLPMLLQIPIFIAFYQGLAEAIELKGAPFVFWIHDLSQPDKLFTLPFSIPFFGDGINILPILMIGSMVWQQKLTPTTGGTPEQAKMMQFMPIIFGFLFYNMPSGLVLYWFVNNVLSIIHQIFIKRIVVVLHHEDRD